MKVKILFSVLCSLVLLVSPLACDDKEKIATLEGSWQGTKAEAKVLLFEVPTGFEEEDVSFHPTVEFKEGGIAILNQDGTPSQGTWSQDGEHFTTSLNFDTNFVDLSGTYTIKTLTETALLLCYEKEGSFKDPDTGIAIEGTLQANLYFSKK